MPGGVEITWYGHGTWGHKSPSGTRIIVDPWLAGNPKCPPALATPEVASANWFDARIGCSFSSTRDVFPKGLCELKASQLVCRACLLCLLRQLLR